MGETTVLFGETKINYFEGPPNGNPLIFLHGVTGRWQSFSHLLPFFIPNYHVYACDLRGHGKSSHIPGGYSLEGYTDDIWQMVQQIIQEPVAIFGHSLGGRITIQMAVSHPEWVSAIIVGDTPLRPLSTQGDSVQPFIKIFELWKALKDKNLPLIELSKQLGQLPARAKVDGKPQIYADFWNQADLLYTARCVQMVDDEILTQMGSGRTTNGDHFLDLLTLVICPALFIQGDPNFGALLTDEDLQLAIKNTKNPYHTRLKNAGHGIHEDNPLEVAKIVLRFLSSHDI